MDKQILFVGGPARSGTTALAHLLNACSEVMLGIERYFHPCHKGELEEGHFEEERFLDIQEGDTHRGGAMKGNALDRRQMFYRKADIVGDKVPGVFQVYDEMLSNIPNAKFIQIIRNPLSVAESYQRRCENPDDRWKRNYKVAIDDWNEANHALLNVPEDKQHQFYLTEYEQIFRSKPAIKDMLKFLGVGMPPEKRIQPILDRAAKQNEAMVPKRDEIRLHVFKNVDFKAYKEVLRKFAHAIPQK